MTYIGNGYYDVIVIDPNGPYIGALGEDSSVEVGELVFCYQPDDDNADTGIGFLANVTQIFVSTVNNVRYARVDIYTKYAAVKNGMRGET